MQKYIVPRKDSRDSEVDQKKKIDNVTKIKQKSIDWFQVRKNLITASSAYNIIPKTEKVIEIYNKNVPEHLKETVDLNSNSGFFQSEYLYFKRKLGLENFTGSSATFFGEKYEEVSNVLYTKNSGEKVDEYGILLHSEHPWLGGSPDGISESGKAIEIKTLYTRQMYDNYIPLKYYIQVQIVLEILDLESCVYIETKIEEFTSFLSFWKNVNKNYDFYGAVREDKDREFIFNSELSDFLDFTRKNIETSFFKVLKSNNKIIKRDREFFNEIFPYLKSAKDKLDKLYRGEISLEELDGYVNFL